MDKLCICINIYMHQHIHARIPAAGMPALRWQGRSMHVPGYYAGGAGRVPLGSLDPVALGPRLLHSQGHA